jgi:rare lipoprotein A
MRFLFFTKTEDMLISKNYFAVVIGIFFALPFGFAQWSETGMAAFYDDKLHGRPTSSGELYDKYALTAAHHNLPLGSRIRITRLDNQKSVEVRINDCCLNVKGRIVDLSRAAAEQLDLIKAGTASVKIELMASGDGKNCNVAKKSAPETPAATKPAEKITIGDMPVGTYRVDALKSIDKGYGIQVGAFKDRANADTYVEGLKKQGFKDILIQYDGNLTKAPYKVILGPFEEKNSALGYKKSLETKHKIQGMLVSFEPIVN